MVDVTPLIGGDRQIVESYGPGRFRISGRVYEGSVIMSADRTLPWDATAAANLSPESLAPVLALAPAVDVLLIGCGARAAFLAPALRRALKDAGISADAMDTGAACRTYNVLAAEGRRVAAALIAL